MVSRKITILVILISILILYFLPEIYKTALVMLGWTEMNATISSGMDGEILFLRYQPDPITVGDQASIIVNSTNTGNILGDFKVRLVISKDNETFFNSTCNFSLDVSEEETCIFYYTPNQAVTYQLQAELWDQNEIQLFDTSSKNMTVASKIIPPPSGGPSAPSRPVAPTVKSIEIIDYPSEINGTIGEIKLIPIKVKNTGNVLLNNVTLIIDGIPFFTKVSPDNIKLPSNSTQIFLIRITIPQEAKFTEYNMSVKAVGDSVSDTKFIKFRISAVTKQEMIKSEIEDLRNLIEKIWEETIDLGMKGYNVTDVFDILNQAKENLRIAEDYFEKEDYDNSEKYLENVRTKLEEAVVKISQLIVKIVIMPAFTFQQKMIVILLLGVVLGLIAIIILQRKKLEKTQQTVWSMLKDKWKPKYAQLYPSLGLRQKIRRFWKKEEKEESKK